MAKQLVEYQLEDGKSIIIETDLVENNNGIKRASNSGTSETVQASQKLNDVAKNIGPAAQVILNSLKGINHPKEIVLEFGLKFGAKTGIVFASADTEVNFKVSVKWDNPDV